MRVSLSEGAEQDLRDIYLARADYSPSSADALVGRIVRRLAQLRDFPQSGRRLPEFPEGRIRELIEGDFRIWYEIHEDGVEVFGIVSGRRDTLAELQDPTE